MQQVVAYVGKGYTYFPIIPFKQHTIPDTYTQEDEQLDYLDLFIHTLLSLLLLNAMIVYSLNFIERTQQFRVNICPSDI